MNAGNFARKRALILRRGRGAKHERKAMAHLVRDAGAVPVRVDGRVVAYRMPDGGTVCELRRYRDVQAAHQELQNVHAFAHLSPGKRLPVRPYECPFCGGWHVTSQR